MSADPVDVGRGETRGVGGGEDGLPVDRRVHDAAEARGMDAPPRASRGGVFFNEGRLVRALGGGRGGFRPRAGGRGLGAEQRQLDVAQLQLLLLPVLSGVRAGEFWQEVRQGGRLHPQVFTPAERHAGQVHIRAVDCADRGAEEGWVRRRRGLSGAHRGPRGGVEGVHRKDRGGLQRPQKRHRGEHRRRRKEAQSRGWSLRLSTETTGCHTIRDRADLIKH
mmetsp:Transcript_14272/g.60382  ORF Transcript_14272/g.60382 Transcript_14272/m.60382 type:complete len:221 (+) Transcript_14272:1232-1894(+)